MAINIHLKIEKKDLFFIVAIMIFLTGFIYIVAYNPNWQTSPGNPAVVGHTPDEIEGTIRAFSGFIQIYGGNEPYSLTTNDFGKLISLFNNDGGDPIDVLLPPLSTTGDGDVGKYFVFVTYNIVNASSSQPFRILAANVGGPFPDHFYGNDDNKDIFGFISSPTDTDNDAFSLCKVYLMNDSSGDKHWVFQGNRDEWAVRSGAYPATGI